VMKMVLALRHQTLPATLHVTEPSPHVDWSSGAVRLLAEAVPWSANGHPRRAGVSSFGFSGTNVHAILEEAPGSTPLAGDVPPPVIASGASAWLVSGRSGPGLAAQAGRLGDHLAARPELTPTDVGWSLAVTRSVFEHRAVITGGSRDELAAGLRALAAGRPAANLVPGMVPAAGAGRVVFVFPGQGSQWIGMGRELAAVSPVFAARLGECGRALAPYVDWSLEEVLAGMPGAPALEAASVVQPVLWAVMVSLAAVWQAAGVVPDAVVGHSQGEIAAACVAGILSLEDAAKVVALRSRALGVLAGQGGMLSVAEPVSVVEERVGGFGERVSVAAVNGPSATVVSGDPDALADLAATCEVAGVRTRAIAVDYASHSPQVEVIRGQVLGVLAGITPQRAVVPMVSAMTGDQLDGPELDARYWYDSLRAPVEFSRAVGRLADSGHRVFVEVSPHPVLTGAITDTADELPVPVPVSVTGTLRREDGGPGRVLASLGEAHVHGVAVDWAAVLPAGRRIELPTYAFQHQRYWPAARPALGDLSAAGLASVGHPLLGAAVELAAGQGYVLTGVLSLAAQPWLADHAVAGTVLVPGTVFVELAMRAGDGAGCGQLDELALESPLIVPPDASLQVQVTVAAAGPDGTRGVEIYARPGRGTWVRYASGLLAPVGPEPAGAIETIEELAAWPPAGAVAVPVEGFYGGLAAAGYGYGPAFRGLRAAWRRDGEVFAEVALPEGVADSAGSFGLHPALLDAALQAATLTASDAGEAGVAGELAGSGRPADGGGVRLPFAWSGVRLHAVGAPALRVRVRPDKRGGLSLVAADGAGDLVVSVGSLVTRPVPDGQLAEAVQAQAGAGLGDALFTEEWVPIADADASRGPVAGAAAGPAAVMDTGAGPVADTGADTVAEAASGAVAGAGLWVVVGSDRLGLAAGLAAAGVMVEMVPDVAGLGELVAAGRVPAVVLAPVGGEPAGDEMGGTGLGGDPVALAGEMLGLIQAWLAADGLASGRPASGGPAVDGLVEDGDLAGSQAGTGGRLVVMTRDAAAVVAGDRVADVAAAGVRGLVRSAQAENPGRLVLADLPAAGALPAAGGLDGAVVAALARVVAGGDEPEVAVRSGRGWPFPMAGAGGGWNRPVQGAWMS
jgi:acyl transferase domain-containing protein